MLLHPDEERVRRRAYEIWEREGRPEGCADYYWTRAKEEIAIEDSQQTATEPNPAAGGSDTVIHPEPVEPAMVMDKQADMPGLTDRGDQRPTPKRRSTGQATVKNRTSRSKHKPGKTPEGR